MEISIWIPIITTLAGVSVGGLIGEIRNHIQLNKEEIKVKNQLLYNLLEIRYLIKRRDIDNVFKIFAQRFHEVFGIPKDMVFQELDKIKDFKTSLLSCLEIKNPTDKLEVRYQKAVELLAPIDPILAYRLNGRESLAKYEEPSSIIGQLMTPSQKVVL